MSNNIRFLGCGYSKGLSDLIAVFILIGVAIVFSISFLVLMQSSYSPRQDIQLLQRLISSERLNTVVKYVDFSGDYATLLFKRLDNKERVTFFLYSEQGYIDCLNLIHRVSRGEIVGVYEHSLDEITVLSDDSTYSFKYYARSHGYPDRGSIRVCVLRVDKNALITLRVARPIVEGYNTTELYSTNRLWRLRGSLEFMAVNRSTILIDDTEYLVESGSRIRIQVNTIGGRLNITPIGAGLGLIDELQIYSWAVYINEALLPDYGLVQINNMLIDIRSLKSTMTIEVSPGAPEPGYIRVRYGDEVLYEGHGTIYVKTTNWLANASLPLFIELNNETLYAYGLSYAIYVSRTPHIGISNLMIFVVTYVNNKPYLVDVYRYG